ncbi:undecaprenyl-phosphate glucose phosphotransferase [Breoghania sp. JC706]|uniref:undecaprenyl-phosphate glucose phosphotransferase n=1 Tax=Breoghania sp. JC706 TaxID=3117732 RepID=UPI0030091BA3
MNVANNDFQDRFRRAIQSHAGELQEEPGVRTKVELSPRAQEVASLLAGRQISLSVLSSIVRILEGLALIGIGLGCYFGYVYPGTPGLYYAAPLFVGALLAIGLIQAADGYQLSAFRSYIAQLARIFAAWTIVFAFFALVLFFAKLGNVYSRVWFAAWYAGGLVFFVASRAVLAALVRRWADDGRLERRAIIVGGGQPAAELINELESQANNDIRICGIFDDRSDDRSPPVVAGYPKLGTIAELVEFARLTRIDLLIVSIPLRAEERLLQLLKKLWVLPLDIRLSAHSDKMRFRPRSYSYIGRVPLLDMFSKPITDWDAICKRAFDLLFASIAIVLLSPVMAATALAVKMTSRGPVLFRQKRYGFNNEVIEVLKFRSMYVDQEDLMARKAVTRDDPRVTRVGRFIRKTSIDELPQLFNVMRGELSLVGPRPHALGANTNDKLWDQVIDGYFARHKVKPGVTGWAQINGWRGECDTPDKIRRRIESDLYYIENWSLWLDLYILFLTPFRLFNTENAF